MGYVVEEDTADGYRAKVILDATLASLREPITATMVLKRYEGVETWGLVLQLAQALQVVDTLLQGLDMAIEHRAVCRQTHIVRCAVHGQPLLRRALIGAYLGT